MWDDFFILIFIVYVAISKMYCFAMLTLKNTLIHSTHRVYEEKYKTRVTAVPVEM